MAKGKSKLLGKQTIAQGSMTIAFFTILSGILALFRDRLFASTFLVSKVGDVHQSLDVYYAAFFIPDTVYYLIFLGALAAAFIPIFTSYVSKDEEKEAFYIANSFLNIALICLIFISLIIFIFAPNFIKLIAPGFNLEKQGLTASLVRLMLLSPLLFGISNTAGGILNSYKRFALFSIAPVLYNLGIIFGTIVFYPRFAIYAPAIGVLIGAFLHMIIQLWGAYHLGFRWLPILDLKHTAIKRIFKLMLPRAAALGVERINRWIFTIVASTLAVGSISIINLSNNLQSFPISFFGIPIATAIFPFLAEAASLNRGGEFHQKFYQGFRYIIYLMVPISVLIILLRVQIVRIILGSGNFGWTDTRLTAAAFGIFSLSLVAQGLTPLLARSFYALQDTATPFKLAIWTIIISGLGSLLFTRHFFIIPFSILFKVKNGFDARIIGLPLAFTLSSFWYAILLYKHLKSKIGSYNGNLNAVVWKIILATIIMAIIAQVGKSVLGSILNLNRTVPLIIQSAITLLLGVITYVIATSLMGLEESQKIIKKMKSYFVKALAGFVHL